MSAPANDLLTKAAVLEGLPDHPAVKALLAVNPDTLADARFDRGELTLTIVPAQIRAAAQAIKAAGYNAFEDVTAVDWYPSSPRFQVSYHIVSHAQKERIRLRVFLPAEDPAVETITSVWPGANYSSAKSSTSSASILKATPTFAAS